jgi:hypothetical protein
LCQTVGFPLWPPHGAWGPGLLPCCCWMGGWAAAAAAGWVDGLLLLLLDGWMGCPPQWLCRPSSHVVPPYPTRISNTNYTLSDNDIRHHCTRAVGLASRRKEAIHLEGRKTAGQGCNGKGAGMSVDGIATDCSGHGVVWKDRKDAMARKSQDESRTAGTMPHSRDPGRDVTRT